MSELARRSMPLAIRRQEHAPIDDSRACPDSKGTGHALVLIVVTAICSTAAVHAQGLEEAWRPDDALRIYAVSLNYPPPLERPYTTYGIYLGQGTVITAAH